MNPAISSRLPRFRAALAAASTARWSAAPKTCSTLRLATAARDGPAFAVVGPRRAAIVAPAGGPDPAPDFTRYDYGVPGGILDRVVDVDQDSAVALRAACAHAELRGMRIGIEDAAIPARHAAFLALEATLVPLRDEVEALRRRKDQGELALIREALRCNQAGFAAAQRAIGLDASEFEVFLAVARAIQEAAGLPLT